MLVPRPTDGSSVDRLRWVAPWSVFRADVSFAIGFGAGIGTTVVAWLAGAGHAALVGLVMSALTAAVVGMVSTPLGVTAAAMVIWAFDDGFVVNRFGVLSLDRHGWAALVVIVFSGVAASMGRRWMRSCWWTEGCSSDRPRPRPARVTMTPGPAAQ